MIPGPHGRRRQEARAVQPVRGEIPAPSQGFLEGGLSVAHGELDVIRTEGLEALDA